MNPHTGRDFVQFGKTESVLNKGAEKIAPLFNPPPVLSLEIIQRKITPSGVTQKRTPVHHMLTENSVS